MLNGLRFRARLAPVIVASCLAALASFGATAPAHADGVMPPTLFGPLLAASETATWNVGRDGGISVPLPNGKDLWVFGDTPTYHYLSNKWQSQAFIIGSSAALSSYAPGQGPPDMYEVNVGQALLPSNPAARFVPPPTNIYMPDNSHKLCTKANGALESGRWPTGAALLPDDTNVIVTYAATCVSTAGVFTVEGFGFMEYNWTTNTISVPPVDVYAPPISGAALSTDKLFGSPVVLGGQVTFFSTTCCSPGHVYQATMAPDLTTLSNSASYVAQAISGLPATPYMSATRASVSPAKIQLFEQTDLEGGFRLFSASTPAGPWTEETSGTLPDCDTVTGFIPCESIYIHPELSTSAQLVVSYYLPGYGPGIQTHPDSTLNHTVMAAITLGPSLAPSAPNVVKGVPGTTSTPTSSLSVNFRPGLNNGDAVTNFHVDCTSGDGTPGSADGASSPIVVAPLTTGSTYNCTVAATNGVGTSPTSAPSSTLLANVPGAPTAPAGGPGPGNGAATIHWTAPANANGSPVAGYVVTPYLNGTALTPRTFTTPATTRTISSLVNGQSYTFRVAATNAVGKSALSLATAAIKVGVPAAPTLPTVTSHSLSALLHWTAPNANGSAITGYIITPYLAGVAQTAQVFNSALTTETVTGLQNAKSYTFRIAAKNARGTGPSVLTYAVIIGAPTPPTALTATAGVAKATLHWTAPSNNGALITGYVVTPKMGGVAQTAITLTGTTTTRVISGLTAGQSYTFTVAAKNSRGTGRPSVASNAVMPT